MQAKLSVLGAVLTTKISGMCHMSPTHTYLPEASYPSPVSVSAEPFAHAPTASFPLQEACLEELCNVLFLFSFYLEAIKHQ